MYYVIEYTVYSLVLLMHIYPCHFRSGNFESQQPGHERNLLQQIFFECKIS